MRYLLSLLILLTGNILLMILVIVLLVLLVEGVLVLLVKDIYHVLVGVLYRVRARVVSLLMRNIHLLKPLFILIQLVNVSINERGVVC